MKNIEIIKATCRSGESVKDMMRREFGAEPQCPEHDELGRPDGEYIIDVEYEG